MSHIINNDSELGLPVVSFSNRPIALRGQVTNSSFKQWLGILQMPKIVKAHKNYLTPEIWEETHLREVVYGTLVFQQSSMISIGCHVGGHTLALQHDHQTTFCLYLVKCLIVMHRCAENVTTSSFQQFPWSLSVKFLFSYDQLRTYSFQENGAGFKKLNYYYFV